MNDFSIISQSALAKISDANSDRLHDKQPPVEKAARRFHQQFHVTPQQAKALSELSRQAISEEPGALDSDMPDLPEVSENAKRKLNINGQVAQLLGQFNQLSAQDGHHKLANVLSLLIAGADGRLKHSAELSAALDKAIEQLQAALGDLDAANGQLEEKKALLQAAKQQLSSLQSELKELEEQGMTHDDPRYVAISEKILVAKNTVRSAAGAADKAAAEVSKLLNHAQALMAEHDALIKKMVALSTNAKGQLILNAATLIESEKEIISVREKMALLMAQLMTVINEGNLTKLKNDRELNDARLAATKASMDKKLKEYEEQNQRAEKATKTANCIGKILGGVLTAVGALSVVFGGAGTALMVIGIGLLVADVVSEAVFGFSLTEKLMSPLMEHIFTPLMNAISKVVSDIFDYTPLGLLLKAIDKATGANMMDSIHTAVAAVATIALIIAAAYILKSAGQMLFKQFGQALGKAVAENVKALIQKALQQLPAMLRKMGSSLKQLNKQFLSMLDDFSAGSLKKISLTKSQGTRILAMTGDSIGLAQVGSRLSYGVISAKNTENAQVALASAQISKSVMEMLTKNIEAALDVLKMNNQIVNNISLNQSEMQKESLTTSLHIIKHRKI